MDPKDEYPSVERSSESKLSSRVVATLHNGTGVLLKILTIDDGGMGAFEVELVKLEQAARKVHFLSERAGSGYHLGSQTVVILERKIKQLVGILALGASNQRAIATTDNDNRDQIDNLTEKLDEISQVLRIGVDKDLGSMIDMWNSWVKAEKDARLDVRKRARPGWWVAITDFLPGFNIRDNTVKDTSRLGLNNKYSPIEYFRVSGNHVSGNAVVACGNSSETRYLLLAVVVVVVASIGLPALSSRG